MDRGFLVQRMPLMRIGQRLRPRRIQPIGQLSGQGQVWITVRARRVTGTWDRRYRFGARVGVPQAAATVGAGLEAHGAQTTAKTGPDGRADGSAARSTLRNWALS